MENIKSFPSSHDSLKESLEMFAEHSMVALRERSVRLTKYFEKGVKPSKISPQLHLQILNIEAARFQFGSPRSASDLEEELIGYGVVPGTRDPDILRFAPVPMYTTFTDIARAAQVLDRLVAN